MFSFSNYNPYLLGRSNNHISDYLPFIPVSVSRNMSSLRESVVGCGDDGQAHPAPSISVHQEDIKSPLALIRKHFSEPTLFKFI